MPTFRNTLFHLHRQVGIHTCLWRWNRQRVPKRQHIKFRRRGITQKKAYNKPRSGHAARRKHKGIQSVLRETSRDVKAQTWTGQYLLRCGLQKWEVDYIKGAQRTWHKMESICKYDSQWSESINRHIFVKNSVNINLPCTIRLFLFYKILQHNLFSGNVKSCEDLSNNNAPYKNLEHFDVTDVNAFSWKQQEAMQMTCDFKTISGRRYIR